MSRLSNSPFVYIIVLTHNNYTDTRKALLSILRMHYSNFRVLVVDNASNDETLAALPAEFPEVELCSSKINMGFARGANLGINVAVSRGAEFVLILNNDVVVDPNVLHVLMSAITPEVGALAPVIYSLDKPTYVWSAGFKKHPLLLEMRGRRMQFYPRRAPIEVDYLLGCAMLLPIAVLKRVGLFDERYFFYYEDLDLSLRLRKQGYKLLVIPDAKVWHRGAGTAGRDSPFRIYHMARSSVVFFRTHASPWQYPAIFLFRLGHSLLICFKFLQKGRRDLVRLYWQGIWDGWHY
jgi:GT2 family glycosyltransferase